MSMAWARMVGSLLLLGTLCSPPSRAAPDLFNDVVVYEMINMHGFTFTEQAMPREYGPPDFAFLLSNCPKKGCVTLTGTYNTRENRDISPLLVEGSGCRPRLERFKSNDKAGGTIILTVPPGPACAGVPQAALGEYFPTCHWWAPRGDLSWTGWHFGYECWSQYGESFPLGPR